MEKQEQEKLAQEIMEKQKTKILAFKNKFEKKLNAKISITVEVSK